MFDVEYGERVANLGCRPASKNVTLRREVLLSLAGDAMTVAQGAVETWRERETEKVLSRILSDSKTTVSRFLTRMLGGSVAATEDMAREIAVQKIDRYPNFMKCWEEDGALRLSARWHATAEKLTYLDEFDVPADEFETMRNYASRKQ